jgi:hypothetical protein
MIMPGRIIHDPNPCMLLVVYGAVALIASAVITRADPRRTAAPIPAKLAAQSEQTPSRHPRHHHVSRHNHDAKSEPRPRDLWRVAKADDLPVLVLASPIVDRWPISSWHTVDPKNSGFDIQPEGGKINLPRIASGIYGADEALMTSFSGEAPAVWPLLRHHALRFRELNETPTRRAIITVSIGAATVILIILAVTGTLPISSSRRRVDTTNPVRMFEPVHDDLAA